MNIRYIMATLPRYNFTIHKTLIDLVDDFKTQINTCKSGINYLEKYCLLLLNLSKIKLIGYKETM